MAKTKTKTKTRPKAKKSTAKAKRASAKKAPKKKAALKKVAPKKKAVPKKKAAPKKAAPKKAAPRKAAPRKAAPRKAAPRKAAPRKAAPKKAAPKKAAPKKVAPKKAAPKKIAPKKVAPEKAAPKKIAPKKVAPEKAAPEKAAPREPAVSRAAAKAEKPRHRTKILPRQFLQDMAAAIREAVAPAIREARGREIVGTAQSGDATFEIDKVAEKALLAFLNSAKLPVAYYSEDAGYSTFTSGQPQNLLVVDPIDGTRAAKCGFESCVVAIASTRVIERPCMADVDNACVMELVGDRTFYAERGKGVRIVQDGHNRRAKLSKNTDLETISWGMTVPARPAEFIFQTAAKLIDLSSLKGGFFACNSTSFSLTRLITNQLDACVDIANRFYRDLPELVKDHFINAGRGVVLGIAPYDLVGALLIVQEAGCIVTDAYGKSFEDVLLLDCTVDNHRSLIAASTPALHKKLLSYFDVRIRQLEDLLKRRAKLAG